MTVYSDEDQKYEKDGRISGRLNEEKPQVFLDISSTRMSEWALYYSTTRLETKHLVLYFHDIQTISAFQFQHPFNIW